jgi:hypothetical protein
MAIYTKKVSVGSFLKKGTDIKDADIVEVRSEGTKVPGEFGVQDIFIVKTNEGKEGNTNFNQTSINNMIDAYGIDSKKWIGQKIKAWIIRQNVGGSFKQVLYFSHPNALFTEDGFVLEGAMECERTAGVGSVETDNIPVIEEGEIDVKDIPF